MIVKSGHLKRPHELSDLSPFHSHNHNLDATLAYLFFLKETYLINKSTVDTLAQVRMCECIYHCGYRQIEIFNLREMSWIAYMSMKMVGEVQYLN